jgi:hypothetical protein
MPTWKYPGKEVTEEEVKKTMLTCVQRGNEHQIDDWPCFVSELS